jgi:hypothetical protein
MKKAIFNLVLLASLISGLMWPQAQPKPTPSPAPQATAPATTPGPCAADYYRNSNGVCVHRPVKTQNSAVLPGRPLSAGMDRIRSVSTDQERVRIMEEWQSGCEMKREGTNMASNSAVVGAVER